MRPIKLFLVTLFFFILFVIQTTIFFPVLLIIIIALLFLWLFFEKPEQPDGIILSGFVGFFWDLFSSGPLGLYFSIFLLSAILLKLFLNKYVQISK